MSDLRVSVEAQLLDSVIALDVFKTISDRCVPLSKALFAHRRWQGKHSAHARAVMGSAGFGGCYGESACAGGRQGLPSMRSCKASMALRPCLRAVSM